MTYHHEPHCDASRLPLPPRQPYRTKNDSKRKAQAREYPRSIMMMATDFTPMTKGRGRRSKQVSLTLGEAEELSRTVLLTNMPLPPKTAVSDLDVVETATAVRKFYTTWLGTYGPPEKVVSLERRTRTVVCLSRSNCVTLRALWFVYTPREMPHCWRWIGCIRVGLWWRGREAMPGMDR